MNPDPLWISIAFALGFVLRQVGLPPLVGYLIAGFMLQAMGAEGGAVLDSIADLGVLLLLFTIGLKSKLSSLARPEVWGVAVIHTALTVVLLACGVFALGVTGLSFFAGLDLRLALLVGFALSFSSTVFAVKILEEKAESASLHGRVMIGILIMQDLFAAAFLSLGKTPSAWALLLPALLLLRPALSWIIQRSGHGELLLLFGLCVTLLGYASFDYVRLKGDLGALVFGMLLAGHPKASELAKSLFGIKDILLVGFFLSIGLSGALTAEAFGAGLLLAVAVPVKVALFFALLIWFRLRVRTALLSSLGLATYSEFGLIVASVAVANGWLPDTWLAVLAIAVSVTFVLAAPLNSAAHRLYARYGPRLRRFETRRRLPDDQPIDLGAAEIVVVGMGRVGTGAYDYLHAQFGDVIVGLDHDATTVKEQRAAGRHIFLGDPTDPDLQERIERRGSIRLILLTLPNHHETLEVVRRLREFGYTGLLATTVQFADHQAALEQAGVDAAFNLYAEAGSGFAEHVCRELQPALAPQSAADAPPP